jgi:hypothetical protein
MIYLNILSIQHNIKILYILLKLKIFNVLENRKMTLSVRMTGLFVDMMRTAQVSTTTLSKKKSLHDEAASTRRELMQHSVMN